MPNASRSLVPDGWQVLALPTPTLPPATTTNTALVGGREFVVIDPGTPHDIQLARLREAIDLRVAAGGRLAGICLTHQHADHWGGLHHLTAQYGGVCVWAHARTHVVVSARHGAVRRDLEDGDTLDLDGMILTAVHTPGHTRGHLSYLDRAQGVAYAGDVVASEGTIVVDPPDGDMAAYLDSLARLLRLDLRQLVPSHGAVIEDPGTLLGWYVQHRLQREAQVLDALGAEPEGLEILVQRAYPEVPPIIYPLAARSLLAHLIKLGDEGRAQRVGERWCRVDARGDGPVHNR